MTFRVVAAEFGDPREVLRYEPFDLPPLAPTQVRLKMLLSPVNPSDLIPVTGAYRHRTHLPFVPGFEGLGVVTHVGSSVDDRMLGKRVIPVGAEGNWQTHKHQPSEWCLEVPDDIEDEPAALAYVNPLTALLMVERLAVSPRERIGITAANSAIGRMLIRLVRERGGVAVAIVRSETAYQSLQGETVELLRDGESLPALHAGLDAVGGATGERLAAAIRPGGTLLHYGLLSGEPLRHPAAAKLELFRLRDWVHAVPRQALRDAMDRCFAMQRAGLMWSRVEARYALQDFAAAIEQVGRMGRHGKVLLDLAEPTK